MGRWCSAVKDKIIKVSVRVNVGRREEGFPAEGIDAEEVEWAGGGVMTGFLCMPAHIISAHSNL